MFNSLVSGVRKMFVSGGEQDQQHDQTNNQQTPSQPQEDISTTQSSLTPEEIRRRYSKYGFLLKNRRLARLGAPNMANPTPPSTVNIEEEHTIQTQITQQHSNSAITQRDDGRFCGWLPGPSDFTGQKPSNRINVVHSEPIDVTSARKRPDEPAYSPCTCSCELSAHFCSGTISCCCCCCIYLSTTVLQFVCTYILFQNSEKKIKTDALSSSQASKTSAPGSAWASEMLSKLFKLSLVPDVAGCVFLKDLAEELQAEMNGILDCTRILN